jgi:HEAT repeat protein
MTGFALAAGFLVLGSNELLGQTLAGRVSAAPDGYVRFQYEARPGVCGNGHSISTDGEGRARRGDSDDCDCACEEGPVRIEMQVEDGVVRDLDADVGGSWGTRSGMVTDLGDVPPAEAADYLLALAESSRSGVAEDAIFPATIARGVEAWPRLLRIARNDDVHSKARRQAVFWLGQEASERATEGLESIIQDEDELEVRESAVFALSQRPEEAAVDALIRIARDHEEPELRKRAIFWLGQRGEDPRVLELFEELLAGGP